MDSVTTPFKNFFHQYIGVFQTLKFFWRCYGGTWELVTSPYLHVSIILAVVLHPVWLTAREKPWYEYPIGILPNVLGVTLAGYALLLAFGDEKFKKLFAGNYPDGKPSPFLVTNAKFIHFILMQAFAIFFGVAGSALELKSGFFAFVGFTVFIYSLTTAVAAGFAALTVAMSFDELVKSEENNERDEGK